MFLSGKNLLRVGCCVLVLGYGADAFAATGSPIGGPGPAITGGGGNLTAFSGNVGAMNNNQWNQMMNAGKGAPAPVADFGNCNSVILRCASPRCASGGCVSMDVTSAIVRGCVQSNPVCEKYGNDLVEYISAQLVAQSTAKANEQQAAAAAAAAAASNAQSEQQLQQMQYQMQQMQSQMAQQQEESAARVEAALAEQQRLAAEQAAAASAAAAAAAPAASTSAAIDRGVSAETIARNQISGQIMTKLDDVSASMKTLKVTMQNVFEYAGCDNNGAHCTGPKRVAAFKNKASAFFDPFENVQDAVYDALIQAQALGVDISDIYMMLNGSCNVWGKYLCTQGSVIRCNGVSVANGCTPAMSGKVAPQQPYCQLIQMLSNSEEVQQNWLDVQEQTSGGQSVQIACASDALDNSKFFANRRKKIDDVGIEDLSLVLGQDAVIDYRTGKIDIGPCWNEKVNSAQLQNIIMTNRVDSSLAFAPATVATSTASTAMPKSIAGVPVSQNVGENYLPGANATIFGLPNYGVPTFQETTTNETVKIPFAPTDFKGR